MLSASGSFKLGKEATIRSIFLLGRGIRAHAIERRHLVFDSRFVPDCEATEVAVLHLVIEGEVEIAGAVATRMKIPGAWMARQNDFEGTSAKRAFTIRSWGSPYRGIDIRLPIGDLTVDLAQAPTLLNVDQATFDSASMLLGTFESSSDAAVAMRSLLATLAARGIVRAGFGESLVEPHRLWEALGPLAKRFQTLPTLQDLSSSSGMSLRQVSRDMAQLVGTIGVAGGFREATRRSRLTLAAVALSAPDVTIQEVAKAVGYGSVDALSRAFRDAELPAPNWVRAKLLERSSSSS